MGTVFGIILAVAAVIGIFVLMKRADNRRAAQQPPKVTEPAKDSSDKVSDEEVASDADEEVPAANTKARRAKDDSDENGGEKFPALDTTDLSDELDEARQNVERYLPTFDLFVRQYIVDPALQSRWLTAVKTSGSQNVSERIYLNALERIRSLVASKKRNSALTLDEVIEFALDIDSFTVFTKGIEATYVPKDVIPQDLAVYHAVRLHHHAKWQASQR